MLLAGYVCSCLVPAVVPFNLLALPIRRWYLVAAWAQIYFGQLATSGKPLGFGGQLGAFEPGTSVSIVIRADRSPFNARSPQLSLGPRLLGLYVPAAPLIRTNLCCVDNVHGCLCQTRGRFKKMAPSAATHASLLALARRAFDDIVHPQDHLGCLRRGQQHGLLDLRISFH